MKVKKIWIITLFPDYFKPLEEYGVLGSALRGERSTMGSFELHPIQLSEFSPKGFKGVDSSPFGGGVGMIIRPDVLENALIEGIVKPSGYQSTKDLHIVFPAPRGEVWNDKGARAFAKEHLDFDGKDIVFICGRYEGVDERFLEEYVDQYISLGDYILTGGELAVMTILDSAMRFAPGVVGNKTSVETESFANDSLEYALYTKPREWKGRKVPDPLLEGHHKKIEEYKEESSKAMTKMYRPDLLDK